MSKITVDLQNIPLTEILKSWGGDILNAQFEMDRQAFELTKMLENHEINIQKEDGTIEKVTLDKIDFGTETDLTLLQLGLIPQFFQMAENNIEIKMNMSWKSESTSDVVDIQAGGKATLGANADSLLLAVVKSKLLGMGLGKRVTANVSAATRQNSAKYRNQSEITSSLRVKIVPIEPSDILKAKIQAAAALTQTSTSTKGKSGKTKP